MISPIGKLLGEGNCVRVTERGEEACECVDKPTSVFVVGRILAKAARLRTETSYKAGSVRRARPSVRSRTQTIAQVNDELVFASVSRYLIARLRLVVNQEKSGRSRGISMDRRLSELRSYLRGWIGYYGLAAQLKLFDKFDQWIRRRIRMCGYRR